MDNVNCPHPRIFSSFHIPVPVTDHPRLRQDRYYILQSLFPASTNLAFVTMNCRNRPGDREKNTDHPSALCEHFLHCFVDSVHIISRVKSFCNTRLIGNDDQQVSCIFQQTSSLRLLPPELPVLPDCTNSPGNLRSVLRRDRGIRILF
jgi:hypothetical protein